MIMVPLFSKQQKLVTNTTGFISGGATLYLYLNYSIIPISYYNLLHTKKSISYVYIICIYHMYISYLHIICIYHTYISYVQQSSQPIFALSSGLNGHRNSPQPRPFQGTCRSMAGFQSESQKITQAQAPWTPLNLTWKSLD